MSVPTAMAVRTNQRRSLPLARGLLITSAMKRYQVRTPLLVVLLIAAVMFGATTWLAIHADAWTGTLEQLVAAGLVAGVGGLRMFR